MLPTLTKAPARNALSIRGGGGEKLSPEHNRFNKLLQQTQALTHKLETLRTTTDKYRQHMAMQIHPLETSLRHTSRDMVGLLVAWLSAPSPKGSKNLTPQQTQTTKAMVCQLAKPLAQRGDDAMRAVYDAYSPQTLAQEQQELNALVQALRAEREALAEKSAQRKIAKKPRKKTAKQQAEASQKTTALQDADSALRTIYRQLVSALHPDREPDESERRRKTTLMQEVNTTYEQRNLLGLLQLQVQMDWVDANKIASMAQEKLIALTTLLKERVTVLQTEVQRLERIAKAEFGLAPYIPLSEATLAHALQEVESDLRSQLRHLQASLHAGQSDDKAFKRWLTEFKSQS